MTTASASERLIAIDALGAEGERRTRNRETISDTVGTPVAELSIVPRLYVTRTIGAQRRVRPLPVDRREVLLHKAAQLFLNAPIAGLDFDAYVELTCRVTGLPMTVAHEGARSVAESLVTAFDSVRPARPDGSVSDWRKKRTRRGSAVWARRGDVLAVHAPGNAPGVHGLWPQALALGYRVAIRPSRREPFTAHRLIHALRQAGFRAEDAVYLPTDYVGAEEIVDAADLAIVYGGQDVVERFAGDPTVFTNGPGRSKILITADKDWRNHVDVIVDSISHLGGMACVNATAVLYEGNPAPLAHAIADRLSAITPLPNTDPKAVLPTAPAESAAVIANFLATRAQGSVAILGADQVVADVGDGYAALRPAVHLLKQPDLEKLNTELPFPCVWISPWSRDDALSPLRNSLVLTVITGDDSLIDDLVNEPTVTNVYSGAFPTYLTAPHIPHDGYLADFLMQNKGFIRD
jgi:acyl-CoA reductase-like NAD-dependent aldehyde dehydrogenase